MISQFYSLDSLTNYTATLDHPTVMQSNLYHLRHFSVYPTLDNYFTPQTTGLYIFKSVLFLASALIPQVNIQSVGLFRGGGDHDVEPFVLMTTVYRENIQKRIGLKRQTEITVIIIMKSAVLSYLKLPHIRTPHHQLWLTQAPRKSNG